jgi:hypothetical protein
MRFVHLLACGLGLPLLVLPAFAQSTQQPAAGATQTAPSQPSAAPTLQLRDLPPDQHTPTPEELAQQKAAQMRAQLIRIASAQAKWGPAASAQGMALNLKEVNREKTASGTSITWQLTGVGFTPNMQLTLVRWPLNQNVAPVMSGITVDASGTAICSGTPATPATPAPDTKTQPQAPSCTSTTKAGAPVEVTATAAKGEAIRVALVASDQKSGAAVSLVPFPLEGEDKGCKLSVIRGSKDDELVLLKGEGFKQDATYTLGTEAAGVKHPLNVKLTPQGTFIAAMTPWVPNQESGDTVVYYQSATCTPTVSFHWGKDTYKPE